MNKILWVQHGVTEGTETGSLEAWSTGILECCGKIRKENLIIIPPLQHSVIPLGNKCSQCLEGVLPQAGRVGGRKKVFYLMNLVS
jgi:hypothetical protein